MKLFKTIAIAATVLLSGLSLSANAGSFTINAGASWVECPGDNRVVITGTLPRSRDLAPSIYVIQKADGSGTLKTGVIGSPQGGYASAAPIVSVDANTTVKVFVEHGDGYRSNTKYVDLAHNASCGGTPETPTNVRVIPDLCYGLNSVAWTKTDGATSYEVVKTNGDVLKTASANASGTSINVPYTMPVGVQACNADGCSDVSSYVTAQRYNVCY